MSFDTYRGILKPDPIALKGSSDTSLPLQKLIKDITEIHHEHQDDPDIYYTAQEHQTKKKQGKFEEFSVLLRRKKRYTKKDGYKAISMQVEIRDPIIQKALQVVLGPVRYLNLQTLPLCLNEPFRELFWFRKELQDYQNRQENTSEEQESFGILSEFIADRLHKTIQHYDQMVPQGFITYAQLWTIFRPSSWVLSMDFDMPQMYSAQSFRYLESSERGRFAELTCLMWNFETNTFGISSRDINMCEFDGTRKITDLDVYPFESLSDDDKANMYERLLARGKKWMALTSLQHRFYNGVAFELKESMDIKSYGWGTSDRKYRRVRRQVRGRVILDHATSIRCNPGSTESLLRWTPSQHLRSPRDDAALPPSGTTVRPDAGAIIFKHSKDSGYQINDQQAVITPITVPGYSLEDKCWMDFDVEKLQEIEWEENCLLKLEVDPLIRNTLDILVRQHTALSEGFKDVVAGKGQGLTVLLHGPPGSGKTLTAEVISEHSQKPLLRITSGDLGIQPGVAEKKLQEYFTLAQAWKAILLLDEADVFLARRTTGDIVRNAFTTVFLRSMEYYAGIMLLTTNQKEAFDEAFQSRIHLQIPYLPANCAQRKTMWMNIVAAQRVEHTLDEAAFKRLATTYKRNGREIKNMVLLALMISNAKGGGLDEDTINAVGKMDSRSEGEFTLSRSNTGV